MSILTDMNNILITSAGKRVSLTRKFMQELKSVYADAKVYTVDMNPKMAPACAVSDGWFAVPRCTTEEYIPALLDICINHQIKVIIPTIDTELTIIAASKELFRKHGIHVLVPDYDFVTMSCDKRKTAVFFKQHDIRMPEPRDKNHPKFPMFAKPYDGSLSTNVHILRNHEDLTETIMNDKKLIFMEYVDKADYKEYTVDLYYGRDNSVKSIVPRERIEVRAGEISKGITRKNYLVSYLKERLGYLPGVVGCICVQLFYQEKNNDVIGIEINPRYGGGYPLSYCAGANFPKMTIEEYLKNETISYEEDWRDNAMMLRYDDEIIIFEDKPE